MSRSSTDQILDDLRAVVDDAEILMQDTAGRVGEEATAARERAREALSAARERLQSLEEQVLERSRDAAKETDRYVHENPWQAISVAAGIGLLLGLLLGRR